MELRELRTFLQVAQHKSFSGAARELGYSQAAVTIQIKNLEQELNTPLFDRLGKQIALTQQGEIFYTHASSILKELDRAMDAVTKSDGLSGRLTIGTIESICATVFPDLLREYHKLYPNVNVNIVLDSPDVLLDLMNKNSIDLVYLLDKRMYDSKWFKVLEEPEDIVFVSPSTHPMARRKDIPLEEVIREPFILTEKDASYRYALDRFLAYTGMEIKPFLEIGNTEFIINQLKSSNCLSFLPEFTVRDEVKEGSLSILKVKKFQMQAWRQLLYHKEKWVTKEMDAFINLAIQKIS